MLDKNIQTTTTEQKDDTSIPANTNIASEPIVEMSNFRKTPDFAEVEESKYYDSKSIRVRKIIIK